ncbi:MAG: hypothetical protein FWD88_02930 [Treponema sp.]|nr:hypothetical protein [Treponema sp.]
MVLADGPEGGAAEGELLSWSASAKGKEGWFRRMESGRSALLFHDRGAVFGAAPPARHDRVLIPLADDGLLLWESMRRCPEGLSAALVGGETARDALLRYAVVFDETEQPEIAVAHSGELLPTPEQATEWFSTPVFDRILVREPWKKGFPRPKGGDKNKTLPPGDVFDGLAASALPLLSATGSLVLLCSPPLLGQRISGIIAAGAATGQDELAEKIRHAEDAFFAGTDFLNWNAETVSTALESRGFSVRTSILDQAEERLVGPKDIDAWFDSKNSRWGVFMGKALAKNDFSQAEEFLRARIQAGPIPWKWKSVLLVGTRR